ncbi:hypothetical protein P7J04_01080 [Streptococcus suis]
MSRLEYFFRYNTDIFKNSNEMVKINWKTKQKNEQSGWVMGIGSQKKHRDINDFLGAIFILFNISWEFL